MEKYITQNWKEIREKVRAVCKHHDNFDDLTYKTLQFRY
jgi:hypothetical protein